MNVQRLSRAAFPGNLSFWFGALTVIAILAVFSVRFLGARTVSLTGTNSVAVAAIVADTKPGQLVCVRDLFVPKATGRVEVAIAVKRPPLRAVRSASLILDGRRHTLRQSSAAGQLGFVTFDIPAVMEDVTTGVLCLRSGEGGALYGGASVQRTPGAPLTTVARAPLIGTDIAVRFRVRRGAEATVLSAMKTALDRAGIFESGTGTMALRAALPGLVLLIYLILRIAAVSNNLTVRRLALLAMAVAFAHGVTWAVLLHPFHGADESEHFAYAQHFAATDDPPDATVSRRPPYSSSELRLLEALHHNSTILNIDSRPRWESYYESRYRHSSGGTRSDDGGGYTESATGHSPLYYAVVGLPLRVMGSPSEIPTALFAMRLLNAMLAAAVAGLAVLTGGLVFGRHHGLAWLAGVLAGLQPVFGSVSGSVNNDTAVNVVAALFVWLAVRTWCKGPTLRRAVAIGVAIVLLPVSKVTGFGLVPVIGVLFLALACSYEIRRVIVWAATVGAVAALSASAWIFLVSPGIGAGQGALLNVHTAPSRAAESRVPAVPAVSSRSRVEYAIQTYLHEPVLGVDHWGLPGKTWLERSPAYNIYIKRGYGLYGWRSVELTDGLYWTILATLLIGWAAVAAAALRFRRRWREWWGVALLLAASLTSVLAFISYAYATNGVRAEIGEQGRYVFPAMVPLAVAFAAGVAAVPARPQSAVLGAAVAGTGALTLVAWSTALRGWFM